MRGHRHTSIAALFCCMIMTIFVTGNTAAEDADGFRPLFNGKDLTGWTGDMKFWRVENGEIVGETTPDNEAPHNTFLIYRDKEFGNFELKFSYQVTGYNSGVQYRSVEQDDFVVTGYQADFEDRHHKADGGPIDRFSGMFFEEKGRMFMGQRGEAVIVRENTENPRKPHIEKIADLGTPAELEKAIDRGGWNDYRIIANGYQFTHIINDHIMSIGHDEDLKHRRASGIIAFQLHSGPPMQIRIKDLRIREIGGE